MSSETFKEPAGKRFLLITAVLFLFWACLPLVLRLTQILSS
ncbi:hypothetical protein V6D52_12475 [Idiomarina loihiensis]|jgi:hypothetical protein|nr:MULTISPECIES: hypothetical protein [Idiomarina]PWW34237.1 hypothetical protein DFO83_11242 [Idiomarina loihiensis]TDO49560.1 hypothetical protein DEU30_105146 [Idiomarina sp. 017G]TDP44617.1 hypothetical protein DET58_11142 [Idiomarina loihiensis]TDS20696.1 hypothetical protein DET62_11142 [Idiomarina sp. H2]